MAFDEVEAADPPGKLEIAPLLVGRASLVATRQSAGGDRKLSGSWTRKPPSIWRRLELGPATAAARRSRACSCAWPRSGQGPPSSNGGRDEDIGERALDDLLRERLGRRDRSVRRSRRRPRPDRRPAPVRSAVPRSSAYRNPARVRVLHDHRRRQVAGEAEPVRAGELVDELPGRFRVEQVQVGELAAAVLDGTVPPAGADRRASGTGSPLMRVLPVAQHHAPLEREVQASSGSRRPRRRRSSRCRRSNRRWRRRRRPCARRRHAPAGGGSRRSRPRPCAARRARGRTPPDARRRSRARGSSPPPGPSSGPPMSIVSMEGCASNGYRLHATRSIAVMS